MFLLPTLARFYFRLWHVFTSDFGIGQAHAFPGAVGRSQGRWAVLFVFLFFEKKSSQHPSLFINFFHKKGFKNLFFRLIKK
jgi:hypothetical protein